MTPYERGPSETAPPSHPLRLLVALLVALQMGGPVTAAFADAPPAPSAHTDHFGHAGDAGCNPFHDHAACLACRVLSTQPLGAAPVPMAPAPRIVRSAPSLDRVHRLPQRAAVAALQARAPPSI